VLPVRLLDDAVADARLQLMVAMLAQQRVRARETIAARFRPWRLMMSFGVAATRLLLARC